MDWQERGAGKVSSTFSFPWFPICLVGWLLAWQHNSHLEREEDSKALQQPCSCIYESCSREWSRIIPLKSPLFWCQRRAIMFVGPRARPAFGTRYHAWRGRQEFSNTVGTMASGCQSSRCSRIAWLVTLSSSEFRSDTRYRGTPVRRLPGTPVLMLMLFYGWWFRLRTCYTL